jgi:hypothetical protein
MRNARTMCEIQGVITPSKLAVDQATRGTSSGVPISVMTIACGIIAAGSYFAQPLAPSIAQDLGLSGWSFIPFSREKPKLARRGYGHGLLSITSPSPECLEDVGESPAVHRVATCPRNTQEFLREPSTSMR